MKKRKIKRTKLGFWTGFLLAILLIASALLFMIAYDNYSKNKKILGNQEIPEEIQDIIEICKNKPLVESAECVNIIVKGFYKYNVSNIDKGLNFSELVEQGGVCWHYANLYFQIGFALGFYVENPSIRTGYENMTIKNKTKEYQMNHQFAIWSNDEGYVILDQKRLFSFKFERNNLTK